MLKLVLLNLCLIAIIVVALLFIRRYVTTEKGKRIILIIAAFLTIGCHYSSLLYHLIKDGTCMDFLTSNPNLVLPIYPCNVVMWCCVILAFSKKNSKMFNFLVDYIFLFGVISCLVGMFANVDFVRNPSLKDYDVTKGIVAHGFMFFNVLLIPTLGLYKLDLLKNIKNIFIGIVMMLVVGLYCNLLITVIDNADYAYQVNSMFLIHSPFDGLPFLKYPLIAGLALIVYFLVFAVLEWCLIEKENRWYKKLHK